MKQGIDVVSVIQRAQRVIQAQSRESGDGADHMADDLQRARMILSEFLSMDPSDMAMALPYLKGEK